MDRRHRPLLSLARLIPGVGIAALLMAGNARAQGAAPTPSAAPAVPSVSATPWVQASPPPGMAATPKPVDSPRPPKPPKPPKPAATPAATPTREEEVRAMMLRRSAEQHEAERKEAARQEMDAARLSQLPPDEREAYQKNLPLWRQLPPDEREELRRQANERARQEMDKAYQESGLNLDSDQREVFELRYRQERRRVERELQEKANAERARRLVEVSERLKHEFAGKTAPGTAQGSAAPATPAPKKAPSPPPAANPEATPTPGFMR